MIPLIEAVNDYQTVFGHIFNYTDAFSYCYNHDFVTVKWQEDVDPDISYAVCKLDIADLGTIPELINLPSNLKSWYSKKLDATKIIAYDDNGKIVISFKLKNGWDRLRYSTTFEEFDERRAIIEAKENYVASQDIMILYNSFLSLKTQYEEVQEKVRRVIKAYFPLQGVDLYWDKIDFIFRDEYFQKLTVKKELRDCTTEFINYVSNNIQPGINTQICYCVMYRENSHVVVDPEKELFIIKFSYIDNGNEKFLFSLNFINYNQYNNLIEVFAQ